jgi:hypothetical protein
MREHTGGPVRRGPRALVAAALAGTLLAAPTAFSATIPADLAARADQLRREASPQVLAWVDQQAQAIAKGHPPVDVAALQAAVRSRFGTNRAAPAGRIAQSGLTYTNLGRLEDGDIMAIAFLVLMEASKSAQEDLKAIMAGVKAANNSKAGARATLNGTRRVLPTPTPSPDRVAELVAAARKLVGTTRAARLTHVVVR